MQKVTKFTYWLLFNSVMFSLASLLLAWISGEDNSLVNWFNGMTLCGTIAAIYLFFAHLIVLILSIIVRAIQEDDTK
jgi:hypothetical protein